MQFSHFIPPTKCRLPVKIRRYRLYTPVLLIGILALLQIILPGCKRDFDSVQPIQENGVDWIQLTIERIGVKDVWLNLRISNPGDDIWVFRDTTQIFAGNVNVSNTILHDSGLLPEHNYSYIAYRIRNQARLDSSSMVLITTKPLWNLIGLADSFAVQLKVAEPYLYVCAAGYGLWRTETAEPEANWKYLGFGSHNPGISPFSGVQDILIRSDNSDQLLISNRSTDHKIYKSLDGGNSWSVADSGLGEYASIKRFVECTNHILAGGLGIYVSYDFGEYWEQVENLGGIQALKRHPLSSNVVWCGGSDAISNPFLSYSVDSGINWTFIPGVLPSLSTVWSIEFDPVDDAIVYVGGGGLMKTVDGGQNWSLLFSGIIREVWVDPNNGNHLWIVVNSSEIFETWDGGITWKSLENPIPSDAYIWDIIWHENTQTIFLATTSGVYSYEP